MKRFIYISPLLFLIAACGSVRKATTPAPTVTRTTHGQPGFIESISMTPGEEGPGANGSANTGLLTGPGRSSISGASMNIENGTALQFKYAILLDENVEAMNNLPLLQFIDEWFGTRYKYGGNSKDGIDCSGFTCTLEQNIFGKTLPRTSREQFEQAQKIDLNYLQTGDLVFFNTRGGVSHVGIYLSNNKFVHASTSSGVTISDLNEDYYRRRFVGAGRL